MNIGRAKQRAAAKAATISLMARLQRQEDSFSLYLILVHQRDKAS
jgi:hypothetical protein